MTTKCFILRLMPILITAALAAEASADDCGDGIRVSNPLPTGRIALTFDDGPDPDHTPKILDTLKKHNIKATFFVIGAKAKKYPELVKRIRDEGHRVGNHSMTHQDFSAISDSTAYRQILQSAETISKVAEQKVDLFRFPEGKASCIGKKILSDNDLQYLGWDIDTCDWIFTDGVVTDEEAKACGFAESERKNMVLTAIKKAEQNEGGVMLLHDTHENTARDLNALIIGLREKKFHFSMPPDQSITAQAAGKSPAPKTVRVAN
jgi:peptidoglycan/xylan/chitin deacetylase (PgdA/CDA1 family)